MKETPILRDCLTSFSHRGYQILLPGWRTPFAMPLNKGVVWRNNVGGLRDSSGRHFIRYGVNGMPDIMGIAFPSGLAFGYEVKKPGEKPTEMQIWFGNILTALGGRWGWGTSYESCIAWQKEAGL